MSKACAPLSFPRRNGAKIKCHGSREAKTANSNKQNFDTSWSMNKQASIQPID